MGSEVTKQIKKNNPLCFVAAIPQECYSLSFYPPDGAFHGTWMQFPQIRLRDKEKVQ